MKIVIFGVIAFVVGLGASIGVVMSRTPPPAPAAAAADSTAADSSSHAEPAAATPEAAKPEVEPAAVPHGPEIPAAVPVARAADDSSATPGPVAVSTPEQLAKRAQLFKRVARILVAMKPADAVEIMNRLDNDQLDAVIRALDARQAATLLAQLPPERAAELSRRILETPPEVN